MHKQRDIYYLPGFGGRLSLGLGAALRQRGYEVWGREMSGEFKGLSLYEQASIVSRDLQQSCCSREAKVVANSFGAYLFLHAQTLMKPFPGRLLFLSPIVGAFGSVEKGRYFSPPYAEKVLNEIRKGSYPSPQNLEIYSGSEDWQSPPALLIEVAERLGASLHVIEGQGHRLDPLHVSALLDKWLD